LLHRQRSPEDLQQLRAWYKIRDSLLVKQDIKKALELACVCQHPNALWLAKLFAGHEVDSTEEAREVFLGCEMIRALCFAGLLGGRRDEIRRAADLGDAFAQARMALRSDDEESFQGKICCSRRTRLGSSKLVGATKVELDASKMRKERRKTFWCVELGLMHAMVCLGELFGKDDPQRFVWLGRAAASGDSFSFFIEMRDQMREFNSGTGLAKIVFVVGRALKGHINSEN
jgi:hypothetical protein